MSRIGNKPISILDGVKVAVDGQTVNVEGPLGKIQHTVRPEISVKVDDETKAVCVSRSSDHREARAYHGLTRSLIANMVEGVKNGYEKKLEIVGVGYIASISGNTLQLRVGYANEIKKTNTDGTRRNLS